MTGLPATPRTGQWREIALWPLLPPKAWAVQNVDGRYAQTKRGRVRRWSRRAHAYAHAERLNREDGARQAEEMAALGLGDGPSGASLPLRLCAGAVRCEMEKAAHPAARPTEANP